MNTRAIVTIVLAVVLIVVVLGAAWLVSAPDESYSSTRSRFGARPPSAKPRA